MQIINFLVNERNRELARKGNLMSKSTPHQQKLISFDGFNNRSSLSTKTISKFYSIYYFERNQSKKIKPLKTMNVKNKSDDSDLSELETNDDDKDNHDLLYNDLKTDHQNEIHDVQAEVLI